MVPFFHLRWTGSDDNPGNNAGQGEAGSDRSNIILLNDAQYPKVQNAKADKPNKFGHWANSYPENISVNTFLGFSKLDAISLAMAGPRKSTSNSIVIAHYFKTMSLREVLKQNVNLSLFKY